MKKLAFLILIFSTIVGCVYDPPRPTMTIRNYSDSAIYVYKTCENTLPLHPELKLFLSMPNIENADYPLFSPDYRINAYSYGKLIVGGSVKHPKVPCQDKNLRFFIIKESIMRNYTWQEIWRNQMYEKKIIMTEEELYKSGWKFTYFGPAQVPDH